MNSKEHRVLHTKHKILLVLLGLVGTGIILLSTNEYGAGLSPDSVGYIAAARNMARGGAVDTYDGSPFVVQPPLYPAVLAAIDGILGIDPLASAHIVSALLLGITVYLSGLLFLRYLTSSIAFAILGTVSLLAVTCLVRVSLMAWSEPLFVCLVTWYFVCSASYLEKGDITSLLLLSLSVALACLTRYIGVILILTGLVTISLSRRDSPKVMIRHLFLFTCISALPIGMWVVRNLSLTGTMFGPRASSIFSLTENLSFAFDTVLRWYAPERVAGSRPILMLLGATIGFAAGVVVYRAWAKEGTIPLRRIHPILGLAFLVIVFYTGFLVISSTTTAYDKIDDRLLSPMVVPTTLVLLFALERLSEPLRARFSARSVNLLLIAGIVVWLVFPTRETVSYVRTYLFQGQGFSGKFWQNSETIQYLLEHRTLESECAVYSNAPDVLYLLANLTAKLSPRYRQSSYSPEIVNELSTLRNSWPEERTACLVWFKQNFRPFLFTPDELGTITSMKEIVALDDGTIYSVSKE